MDKKALISFYNVTKFSFQNIYSAGPEMYFERPCIGFIKKGSAKFFHKGKIIYANEGDLIYIPFETQYQSIWYGSPEIEWYSVQFDFNLKHSFFNYNFQILKNYPEELLKKIYESYEESYFISISYLYQLLDDIYKKMETTPNTASYLTIKPAVEYIENNYEKSISIDTLAEYCNISRVSFFRLFKKILKVTPIEYKHNIMIQHAIDLLSNTAMPIEEISIIVGFSSSNYFRKIFFKKIGKTPKELRKK